MSDNYPSFIEEDPSDDPLTEPEDLVAVDFDGTLTEGKNLYWEGEREAPDEEIIEWVREQYYSGCHIVIWTARPWEQAGRIASRLVEWDVPFHGIRCNKGGADLYVDDKSVTPNHIIH